MKFTYLLPILMLCYIGTPGVSSGSASGFNTPLNGWHKYACTAENIKLSKTYYCDSHGKILCLPGWSDESTLCTVPICEIEGRSCVNGNCSKPFTCDCEVGWSGQFCEKCVCLPGCVNGLCNKSLECICKPGWHGMLCDKPLCEGCINGDCVMPGMCVCHAGWSGPNCTVCEERTDCENGRCISEPLECKCYDGYYGSACENPVCKEGCHPVNGFCMMPDTCICKDGWTGPNCTECVPYWNCQHGTCQKPWECNCNPGYFGLECNDTKTVDGKWGSWQSWSSCSVSCGAGTQIRKRHCDNPTKAGNGTYCSIDGSSSTETRPCNQSCTGTTPVNGNWGLWSTYSACSTTCGAGLTTRTRVCDNPAPSAGGVTCAGSASEQSNCTANPACPIDGGFNDWTPWSPCTSKCLGESGDQTRRRFCTNPSPSNGGKDCSVLGLDKETRVCNGTIPRQSTDPAAECFTISS